MNNEIIKILFLAADPSDKTRLRLGQELRDIQEKLQLSKQRQKFVLKLITSVRPGDMSQAILDIEPQIVHFSGHGNNTGDLCFENQQGQSQFIDPEALADLFDLVSDYVSCVLLNACYSEIQAKTIAMHIPFVIGMNKAIGDKAAIIFAIGFYKALGAGYSFEKAYKFGCVEMRLESIGEHLTPVIHTKSGLINRVNSDKIQWMLVLSGTIDDINKSQAEAIVVHLSQLLNDPSLTLKKIESGSIKLFLEGSEDEFEILKELFRCGRITEISGFPIQEITYSAFDASYLNNLLSQAGINQSETINTENQTALNVKRIIIVQPSGRLDASNALEFERELITSISSDLSSGLLVDMSQVENIDSAGLMALLSAFKLARSVGKQLSLISVPSSVMVILELTQLHRVFEILESDSLWEENIVRSSELPEKRLK
nr:anti-sigma factor antagonist [Nostoc sp. EkiNYC01]